MSMRIVEHNLRTTSSNLTLSLELTRHVDTLGDSGLINASCSIGLVQEFLVRDWAKIPTERAFHHTITETDNGTFIVLAGTAPVLEFDNYEDAKAMFLVQLMNDFQNMIAESLNVVDDRELT